MATVTHYIRSEYDPEVDKDRLFARSSSIDERQRRPPQTKSLPAGFPELTNQVVWVERKGRPEITNQSVCPCDQKTCGCDAVRDLHEAVWPHDWPPTVRLQRTPLSSALAPHVRHSSAKQFNRIQSCVFSLFLGSFLPFFLSHIRHPPRSSDTERQTFPKHHKPQCGSCIIQNQDECSQGAPFSCSNVSSPHLYPQLYYVRPNAGKVNPGQTVEVQGAISLIVFNAVG